MLHLCGPKIPGWCRGAEVDFSLPSLPLLINFLHYYFAPAIVPWHGPQRIQASERARAKTSRISCTNMPAAAVVGTIPYVVPGRGRTDHACQDPCPGIRARRQFDRHDLRTTLSSVPADTQLTKFVLIPVVDRTPFRSAVLYTCSACVGCRSSPQTQALPDKRTILLEWCGR